MNKSLITGTLLGAVAVTATGTLAGYNYMKQPSEPTFADVLMVEPVVETRVTPRQQCQDKQVTQQAPSQDPNKIAGTVIGAMVGGIIGNQVGDGNGRKIATLAGAAAGGYAGQRVQGDIQARNQVTTTQRECVTVNDTDEQVVGYDVTYRLGEQQGVVRMSEQPGERIPVVNGQLQLTQAPSTSATN